ncbi:hypothetical protein N9J72_02215 [Candidatus Gracilibacteria bacterium]|nr:hypothetical protein [Candidatus Gracilibacteria bacterium]
MNNKILSVILVLGIASTGFAGISAANSGQTLSGVTNSIEQGVTKMSEGKSHFGKRKGLKNLTDEEKATLDSLSDEEKQAFFAAKKEEMVAQKEASKAVMDKLIAGETLTAAEDATRLEMIAKMAEHADGERTKPGAEIAAKILVGDELTADEETELAEMQEKQAEREAQKALLEPIKAKLEAGETLTEAEQATLDEAKANGSKGKMRGNRGGQEKGGRSPKVETL